MAAAGMESNQADLLVMQEDARKMVVEWMTTEDSLIKEPTYTTKAQRRNDHHLERLRMIFRRLMTRGGTLRGILRGISGAQGIKGQIYRTAGSGALWFVLSEYSALFLKPHARRLGDARAWLDLLLAFESIMRHFGVWSRRFQPDPSRSEELQALRVVWIAIFLAGSGPRAVASDWEPIFALLYPLVDNALDGESDPVKRVALINHLRDQLDLRATKPGGCEGDFAIYDDLMGRVLRGAGPEKDPLSPLLRQVLSRLLDCEVGPSSTELLFQTCLKGGLTIVVLHLLLLRRPPLQSESVALMRLGFTLQVVDDLQDLREDLATCSPTISTLHHYDSPNLRRQYARAINFIRHRLFASPGLSSRLDLTQGLEAVLQESLVSLCIEAAANSSTLRADDRALITIHSPISVDFMRHHPIEPSLHRLASALTG